MTVQFTIPGAPVPKGRPRFTVRGGFASAYTPAETRKYEACVRALAVAAMRGAEPSSAPIEVLMELRMQIPASWSQKKRVAASEGKVRATKKPDLDNIAKGVLDACNGVLFFDDGQIVALTVRKLYHAVPCVIVAVRDAGGESA